MLRDRLLTSAIASLLWLLRSLPGPISYAFGSTVAILLTPILLVRDRLVGQGRTSLRRNFRIAFGPELPEATIRRLTYRVIRHIAWLIIDIARLPKFTAEQLPATIPPDFPSRLDSILKEGRGLLVITGHMGVFEMNGAIGGLLGMPLHTVVHPLKNKSLNELLQWYRCYHGQTLLTNKRVLFSIKKVLKENKIIGVLVDENTKRKPLYLPFFGTLASCNPAIANIHRLLGSPILVVATHRISPGRFKLTVYDEIRVPKSDDRAADERQIMERLVSATEAAVRDHPEQYLWSMRRWRNRPPGEEATEKGLPPRVEAPIPPVL